MVETKTLKTQCDELGNALNQLDEGLGRVEDELDRDGTIQRFEFSFELAWKLMKSVNRYTGRDCFSPRECIRIAAQNKLLDNPSKWIEHLKSRNAASHTYDSEMAEEVFKKIGSFLEDAKALLSTARQKFLSS